MTYQLYSRGAYPLAWHFIPPYLHDSVAQLVEAAFRDGRNEAEQPKVDASLTHMDSLPVEHCDSCDEATPHENGDCWLCGSYDATPFDQRRSA